MSTFSSTVVVPESVPYIHPLRVNGLSGRYLYLPSTDSRYRSEILFIYGQHSSLERWWGMAQELSRYGNVTAPDLPGYGGMQSMYEIGIDPNFDALADWLADYLTSVYRPKRFTLIGLSIGFAIITRMLQRHPELVIRVSVLTSVVGFAHHEDFVFRRTRQFGYRMGSQVFLHRPFDSLLRNVIFHPAVMRRVYHRSFNAKEKFKGQDRDSFERTMAMELELWRINDLRSWMRSNIEMFSLDNTKQRVVLPVLHLSVRKDRYFALERVEAHYRQIFNGYRHVRLNTDSHGPSVIATAKQASVLIPKELRNLLQSL